MKSASQMSALIRAKKKKMQEDPDVIDRGGSPSMDAQDIDQAEREEATEELDENEPMVEMDGENTSPATEMDEEEKEDPKLAKRRARLAAMMSK